MKTRFRDDSSKSLQDGTVSLETVVLTKRQGAKLQVAELKMLEMSTSEGQLRMSSLEAKLERQS